MDNFWRFRCPSTPRAFVLDEQPTSDCMAKRCLSWSVGSNGVDEEVDVYDFERLAHFLTFKRGGLRFWERSFHSRSALD
jgi:hypothetical protein